MPNLEVLKGIFTTLRDKGNYTKFADNPRSCRRILKKFFYWWASH